jgi:hypothetical protein
MMHLADQDERLRIFSPARIHPIAREPPFGLKLSQTNEQFSQPTSKTGEQNQCSKSSKCF